MSQYSEFFLNSNSTVQQIELIEISHPSFSQVYRITRNMINGVTVTLETGVQAAFVFYPLVITPTGASDDLDQTLKVQLGDLGQILPLELDRVQSAGTFTTKPTLIYRVYRSDMLTAPMEGPFSFEITNIAFNKAGSVFEAEAHKLNSSASGEQYTFDRFPMLMGFIFD